jgi:hypothetical protein
MMLTLTIDPLLFESPEAAYHHARERRAIGRLMRDLKRGGHLHSPRYFAVVEWQKDTEMVHFHVLIDATKVPKTAIDKAWSKNRPTSAGPKAPNRPAFGMTRFSKREFKGGAEHAARYATKYLLKVPSHGWPRWVLEAGRNFRIPRYQPSKGLWGGGAKPAEPARVFERPSIRERPGRTYTERIAECGTAVNVFARVSGMSPDSGERIDRRYWLERKPIDHASPHAPTHEPPHHSAHEPTPAATDSPSDCGAPSEAVA